MAAVEETLTIFLVLFFTLTFQNTQCFAGKCTYDTGRSKFEISDWVWSVPGGNTLYNISLCSPLSKCNGASVCKIDSTSKAPKTTNIGKRPPLVALANDGSGFSAIYQNGEKCVTNKAKNYTSEIYFVCGKSLGNLEFVEMNGCTSIFEFTTSEACKNHKKINEIPCLIIDKKRKLRDLTQLVKVKGGHKVASDAIPDFYINVCREITGEVAPGKNCPKGSSSCVGGKDKGGIIEVSSLQLVNDYTISLKYANKTSGCSTNVTLVCPKSVSQPGGSGPVLQSSSGCHYEVIWETEHACPVANQVSSTCNISTQDGVFDLRILKREAEYYKTMYQDPKSKTKYTYFMNVCGNMKDFPCGSSNDTDVAVCQTWSTNRGKITGRGKYMKLRYVDGQLILTYKHGETCSSGIRRTTIITFYCNETANQGSPKFNHEDYCNYFFDWPTSLVCPRARKTGDSCRVITKQNQIYDLTELIKTGRDNWHADDATSSQLDGIYLNVCGPVRKNALTKNCPADSAACVVSGSSSISFGKFESPLVSDTMNSLRLVYTNGTLCDIKNRKRRKAVISLICHPGQLSTAPILVSKSPDKCDYEFVWQTGAACPLGKRFGRNCSVSDPIAGYSLDLSPLANARPTKGKDYFSHLDSRKEYEYQIKVCQGSTQTKCSKDGKSVGACQYKAASGMSKTMGLANANLVYFDGLLKLKYLHGDKCHNGQFRETRITFLCDQNAGVGNPQFEKEVACGTYNFLWYTKYACHSKIVECSVIDPKTKKQYDLSKLSSNHGWQASNGNRKFYLNVCRPLLHRRPSGCSVFSAVCNVDVSNGKETFINDLGSVSESPTIASNGDLIITYTNGSWCDKNKRVTSKIRFICRSGGGEGSPEFDATSSDACNFVFRWETSYACPVGGSTSGVTGTCAVQDPISKYTFDLSPLKRSKDFYRVLHGGDTFILNICGNVSGSNCNSLGSGQQAAACKDTGKRGSNPVIGRLSKQLKYSMGQITLEYYFGERQDDGYEYKTIITFICNKNIPFGKPVYDNYANAEHAFYFKFETSLACGPQPVQCRIAGPDNVMYNLEPLIRQKGYWTALNRETNGQKHHYFINVCQALDERPPACPKGAISACQVDYNSATKGHALGYVTNNPRVQNKTLSIKYLNGEACHHVKKNRSVDIFFHCSANEGSPVFQTETKECGYIFNWLTPSACPRVSTEHGSCKVEDPVFKHVFDLSKITTRQIIVNKTTFIINPCGNTECGKTTGACLKSGTATKDIGTYNDMAHLHGGDLYIEYTNGDVKTNVRFVCDRKEEALSLITDISKKTPTDVKSFEFEWKTPVACVPHYNVECSLFVNGNNDDEMYDLSPLSRWDNDWRAQIDTTLVGYPVNRKIFINVCRYLVKKGDASTCPDEAGVCMIRGSKSINLGKLLKSPYKIGTEIILEFGEGEICKGKEKYSSKIRLTANDEGAGLGEPILTSVRGCTHEFTWSTSVAMPINKNKPKPRSDCKVVNPVTGNIVDLTSFKNKGDIKIPDGRGGYFMLSVCSAFQSQSLKTKCGEKSGVCRLMDSRANYKMCAGDFSQTLSFDKVITLKYVNGDICPKCKCKRETVITFVCAPEEGEGKPVFMSQVEDCTYIFVWRTKNVCQREVQCTAFSSLKAINVGRLSKSNGNIKISSSAGTNYYINICKNLVYEEANPCPFGSAACMITTSAGKQSSMNLGEVTSPPVINADNSVTLTYENGDVCPTDKSKKLKTQIVFKCEHGSKGQPIFKSTDQCVYKFEWKTYEVCDEDEKVDEKKCTIKDNDSGNLFDLSPLKKKNKRDYVVKSKHSGVQYLLNICGMTSATDANCAGAGVCRIITTKEKKIYQNLGLVKYQQLEYDMVSKAIILKYRQDDKGDKKPTSMITFKCDELVDKGQPMLVTDVQASSLSSYVFHWRTSLVCIPVVVPTVVNFNGKNFDLKKLSVDKSSFTTEDTRYTYIVNIFGGIKDGPEGCPKTSAVCRKSKLGDEVLALAPVSSQKVSANATNIIIQYTGGKGICIFASVHVVVECGDKTQLMLVSPKSNILCSYLFVLKTKSLCFEEKKTHTIPGSANGHIAPKKKNSVLIAVVIILCLLFLLTVGYIVKSPERRANTLSCLRFNCKRYVCCKGMDTPGYKYRKVQVNSGEQEEDNIEEREGLLLEDKDDEFEVIYKDEDSEEDEELLQL